MRLLLASLTRPDLDPQEYAIPAGMYASQIWATPYLRQGKEMDNPIQKWLLTVLKRTLGVRDTTPSWCIMRECSLEPLQFNWFRAAMRLYNSLMQQFHNEKDFAGGHAAELEI
eukprot:1153892-Pelagomonas_calceolata.AAC.2